MAYIPIIPLKSPMMCSNFSHFVSVGVTKSHKLCTDSSNWYDLNQYRICLFCMSAVVKEATWAVWKGFQSDIPLRMSNIYLYEAQTKS